MDTLKIAVATPDGERLSPHFGETPWYEVFTVENGQIVARERRAKPHNPEHDHEPGAYAAQHRHGRGGMNFFVPIRDCQVLIVGGMGDRAYEWAQSMGLEVIPTKGKVEDAVRAYLEGTIQADPRRIHRSTGRHHHG